MLHIYLVLFIFEKFNFVMDFTDSSDNEVYSDNEIDDFAITLIPIDSLLSPSESFPHQNEILKNTKPNGLPILKSVEFYCPEATRSWPRECIVGGFEKCPFICSICLGLPRYPIELKLCGHCFCEHCINIILDGRRDFMRSYNCPNCQKNFSHTDVHSFKRRSNCLFNVYKALDVRCSYGCGKVTSPPTMLKHECVECPKRPVSCPHTGCTTQLPDSEMEAHLTSCEHRAIFCNRCKLPKPYKEKKHKCLKAMKDSINSMLYSLKFVLH